LRSTLYFIDYKLVIMYCKEKSWKRQFEMHPFSFILLFMLPLQRLCVDGFLEKLMRWW